MAKEWHETELARALNTRQGSRLARLWQGSRLARLKTLIFALLVAWIAYFAAVNMFARALNKIDVPLLGLPLGVYLVIQGAMVVFVVVLYSFTRKHRAVVAIASRPLTSSRQTGG